MDSAYCDKDTRKRKIYQREEGSYMRGGRRNRVGTVPLQDEELWHTTNVESDGDERETKRRDRKNQVRYSDAILMVSEYGKL